MVARRAFSKPEVFELHGSEVGGLHLAGDLDAEQLVGSDLDWLSARPAHGPSARRSGDYFESCNCRVVCPCIVSRAPPLTAQPTEGVCNLALIFHIDKGSYGDVALDGLNVALAVHAPGPMGEGNWAVGA